MVGYLQDYIIETLEDNNFHEICYFMNTECVDKYDYIFDFIYDLSRVTQYHADIEDSIIHFTASLRTFFRIPFEGQLNLAFLDDEMLNALGLTEADLSKSGNDRKTITFFLFVNSMIYNYFKKDLLFEGLHKTNDTDCVYEFFCRTMRSKIRWRDGLLSAPPKRYT